MHIPNALKKRGTTTNIPKPLLHWTRIVLDKSNLILQIIEFVQIRYVNKLPSFVFVCVFSNAVVSINIINGDKRNKINWMGICTLTFYTDTSWNVMTGDGQLASNYGRCILSNLNCIVFITICNVIIMLGTSLKTSVSHFF